MRSYQSTAWLLRGISSIPGELVLESGSLSFYASASGTAWPWQLRKLERALGAPGFSAAVERGERAPLFKWPIGSLRVWCPWYYFGGGLKLARGNMTLRFSFGRPANSRPPYAAVAHLGEVGVMRQRGRTWMAVLSKIEKQEKS